MEKDCGYGLKKGITFIVCLVREQISLCIKVGCAYPPLKPPPHPDFPPHYIKGTLLSTLALNIGIGCKLWVQNHPIIPRNTGCVFAKQTSIAAAENVKSLWVLTKNTVKAYSKLAAGWITIVFHGNGSE